MGVFGVNEFTKQDVISAFYGTFRDTVAIADALVEMWFAMALGQYELEIGAINYDNEKGTFGNEVTRPIMNTIAFMMKVYYCEREVSRVNKINNIITKDITLNGNGDTKRYTIEELEIARARVADNINKIKTSWFAN